MFRPGSGSALDPNDFVEPDPDCLKWWILTEVNSDPQPCTTLQKIKLGLIFQISF
jgi:hypothetical protein